MITEKITTIQYVGKEKINKHFNGFKGFLSQHSVIPLAIGIIIGQSTKDVVNALVEGIITPLLALILSPIMSQNTLENFEFVVGASHFQIGKFVSAFISMLIVMLVIYITVGIVLKQMSAIGIKEEKLEEEIKDLKARNKKDLKPQRPKDRKSTKTKKK
jgi:large conductance mechanosensitive channel